MYSVSNFSYFIPTYPYGTILFSNLEITKVGNTAFLSFHYWVLWYILSFSLLPPYIILLQQLHGALIANLLFACSIYKYMSLTLLWIDLLVHDYCFMKRPQSKKKFQLWDDSTAIPWLAKNMRSRFCRMAFVLSLLISG